MSRQRASRLSTPSSRADCPQSWCVGAARASGWPSNRMDAMREDARTVLVRCSARPCPSRGLRGHRSRRHGWASGEYRRRWYGSRVHRRGLRPMIDTRSFATRGGAGPGGAPRPVEDLSGPSLAYPKDAEIIWVRAGLVLALPRPRRPAGAPPSRTLDAADKPGTLSLPAILSVDRWLTEKQRAMQSARPRAGDSRETLDTAARPT